MCASLPEFIVIIHSHSGNVYTLEISNHWTLGLSSPTLFPKASCWKFTNTPLIGCMYKLYLFVVISTTRTSVLSLTFFPFYYSPNIVLLPVPSLTRLSQPPLLGCCCCLRETSAQGRLCSSLCSFSFSFFFNTNYKLLVTPPGPFLWRKQPFSYTISSQWHFQKKYLCALCLHLSTPLSGVGALSSVLSFYISKLFCKLLPIYISALLPSSHF